MIVTILIKKSHIDKVKKFIYLVNLLLKFNLLLILLLVNLFTEKQ